MTTGKDSVECIDW